MSSNQIPGVPEGWELARIGYVHYGEWRLMDDGTIERWDSKRSSSGWAVVLRKIEKPARYRPFASAREADQFWNASLRIANSIHESKDSRFRINTIGCDGITIGLEFYSYKAAFDGFNVDDDGTPFGVRIDE
jgi:hypothetical protein